MRLDKATVEKLKALRLSGDTYTEIEKKTGINRGTIYYRTHDLILGKKAVEILDKKKKIARDSFAAMNPANETIGKRTSEEYRQRLSESN